MTVDEAIARLKRAMIAGEIRTFEYHQTDSILRLYGAFTEGGLPYNDRPFLGDLDVVLPNAAEWLQAQAAERELEQATVEELEEELDSAARRGPLSCWSARFKPLDLPPYDIMMSGRDLGDILKCGDDRKSALLAAVREVRKLQGGAA